MWPGYCGHRHRRSAAKVGLDRSRMGVSGEASPRVHIAGRVPSGDRRGPAGQQPLGDGPRVGAVCGVPWVSRPPECRLPHGQRPPSGWTLWAARLGAEGHG